MPSVFSCKARLKPEEANDAKQLELTCFPSYVCFPAIFQLFNFFRNPGVSMFSCVSSDCRSSDCKLNDSVFDKAFDSDLSLMSRAAMTRERIKQKRNTFFTEVLTRHVQNVFKV